MLLFLFLVFSSLLSIKLFYNYLKILMVEDRKLNAHPYYCLLHVWLSVSINKLQFIHFWSICIMIVPSSEIKKKTYAQSIYSINNSHLSGNFLSIWMIMQKYFIAFRVIQIHKIIYTISNTYLIFSPSLLRCISAYC